MDEQSGKSKEEKVMGKGQLITGMTIRNMEMMN